MARHQRVDATQRSFRTICKRTRFSCWRRRSSALPDRRARHEYRYRRRGRSRLETRSGARRVGRHQPAIKLRDRAAPNWFTKRWHGYGIYRDHQKRDDDLAFIEDDSTTGAEVRRRMGEALVRDVGRMFRTIGLQIGYRYGNSPICIPDGTPACPDDPEVFVPSARPGSRAPHVWLGEGHSILDLYGRGFVLLCLGADAPDGSRLEAAAAQRRVPLKTVTITDCEAMQLYEKRLVLVRPDGHVAWRGDASPQEARAVIDRVRGAVPFGLSGTGQHHVC